MMSSNTILEYPSIDFLLSWISFFEDSRDQKAIENTRIVVHVQGM